MDKKRNISIKDLGPRIVGQCTWCKGIVKKPKRYWCSQECVDEYRIRSDSSFARIKVFDRDQGVCAICGLDTENVLKAFKAARALATEEVDAKFEALGFKIEMKGKHSALVKHLWEMDHIVPVVDGGGGCGLDNLRTLCTNCHKQETAKLNKRLKTKINS